MKKYIIAMFLGLGIGAFAHAGEAGKVVLSCDNTHFNDLVKIEIRESASGLYELVEFFSDSSESKTSEKPAREITTAQMLQGDFPELTPWNGYRRNLRYNESSDSFSISIADESTVSSTPLDCKVVF